MARNKYPEETVKRILDVAEELFMTRGYEHTTMQDIIDNLGGLTKGAIYHHFKSKEDIFEAVFERANRPLYARADQIAADSSLTGLEKIRALDKISAGSPSSDMLHAMQPSPDPLRNPRLMAQEYVDAIEVAHRLIEPAIREGMADGSVRPTHPREAAEAIMLLANLWMPPMFLPLQDVDAFQRRADVLLTVARALGVDLVDMDSLDARRAWGENWERLVPPDTEAGEASGA